MRKKHAWMWVLLMLLMLATPAFATETEAATEAATEVTTEVETEAATENETEAATEQPAAPVEIYTTEDLQQMAQNPEGIYILMNDLNMAGIPWKSLDFKGTFDGNGHTIFNLTLSEPSDAKPESLDGNLRTYETRYVGFFGTLQDAQVKNLTLMGLNALVVSEEPCFLGGIAGYMDNSSITNCTVSGTLELRAHDRIFGVAGVVGFGKGAIEACTVDVTLICTDTDPDKRDEQFMGGVMAAGFATIRNCSVTIDGYCSEYGYCHNGGLMGMLVEHPKSKWLAQIQDNTITGKITFFEKNTNRRAYCKATVGEILATSHNVKRNQEDFQRDERKEYDVELRPEMCQEPAYTSVVVAPSCESFGYTTHSCDLCGYTYVDQYTLAEHIIGEWTLAKEATYEEAGLWTATCPCGLEYQKEEPKLDPPPTEPATEPEIAPEMIPEATQPVAEESAYPMKDVLRDACLLLIPLVLLPVVILKSRKEK